MSSSTASHRYCLVPDPDIPMSLVSTEFNLSGYSCPQTSRVYGIQEVLRQDHSWLFSLLDRHQGATAVGTSIMSVGVPPGASPSSCRGPETQHGPKRENRLADGGVCFFGLFSIVWCGTYLLDPRLWRTAVIAAERRKPHAPLQKKDEVTIKTFKNILYSFEKDRTLKTVRI